MTDRITYAEAAKILGLPLTSLRAYRKRIGAPESVVVTSGTQPAMFSRQAYEEFAAGHNAAALVAAERYFDKNGVYPNQGDTKPSFNKMAVMFLKGAYLSDSAKAEHKAWIDKAKTDMPKTTRVTVESDWAMKPTETNKGGRIRPTTQLKANGLPTGIQLTRYNTYRVKIKYNKIEHNLGTYETVEDAIKARQMAEDQIRETGALSIASNEVKKSLPKGIHLMAHGFYRVRLRHKNVQYHLGTSQSLEGAIALRVEAERQLKETGRVK